MGNVFVVDNTHISPFFQFVDESFLNFHVTGHNGLPRIIKTISKGKGKVFPLEARCGPEGG